MTWTAGEDSSPASPLWVIFLSFSIQSSTAHREPRAAQACLSGITESSTNQPHKLSQTHWFLLLQMLELAFPVLTTRSSSDS